MNRLCVPAQAIAELSGPPPVHFNLLPPFYVPVSNDPGRQAFTLADMNRDQILDLVVADQIHFTVDGYMGNGDGTFTFFSDWIAPADPTAIGVADLSSPPESALGGAPDGNPDIVVAGGRMIWVLLGRGDGTRLTFSNCRLHRSRGHDGRPGKEASGVSLHYGGDHGGA